ERIDFVCAGAFLNLITRIEGQRKAVQIVGVTPIIRALLLLLGVSPRHFLKKAEQRMPARGGARRTPRSRRFAANPAFIAPDSDAALDGGSPKPHGQLSRNHDPLGATRWGRCARRRGTGKARR